MVKENFNFPRFQRGSNIFQGGPTFSRGDPNANTYRNIKLVIFQGGLDLISPSPLDPRMTWMNRFQSCMGNNVDLNRQVSPEKLQKRI